MKFKTVKEFLEWLAVDETMGWVNSSPYIGFQFDQWSIRVCTSSIKSFDPDDYVDLISGTFLNDGSTHFLEIVSENCWSIPIEIEERIKFEVWYLLKNPTSVEKKDDEVKIIEL